MRYLCALVVISALLASGCKKTEPAPEPEAAAKPEPAPAPVPKPEATAPTSLGDWLAALAKDPASAGKPGPSAIDAELNVIAKAEDPAQKAVDLAKLTEKVIAGCAPATKAFAAVASAAPEQKTKILAEGLAEAVKDEACKLDEAALKAAVWAMAAPAPEPAEEAEDKAEGEAKDAAPAPEAEDAKK